MKQLIPINDYGLFVNKNNDVLVNSRYIAKIFNKEHKDVLRAIDKILKSTGISEEFTKRNFTLSAYKCITSNR